MRGWSQRLIGQRKRRVAEVLRLAERRGWSDAEIAVKAGVGVGSVQRWRDGANLPGRAADERLRRLIASYRPAVRPRALTPPRLGPPLELVGEPDLRDLDRKNKRLVRILVNTRYPARYADVRRSTDAAGIDLTQLSHGLRWMEIRHDRITGVLHSSRTTPATERAALDAMLDYGAVMRRRSNSRPDPNQTSLH